MSPEGDDAGPFKRRKVPRACDYCRKRKIRCDGPQRSSTGAATKCTHCTDMGLQCTYIKDALRKGPPRGYVVTLQERCARLENLVHQLRPGLDIETNVGPPLDHDTFDVDAYRTQLSALDIPPFPSCKPFVATDMARPPGGGGGSGGSLGGGIMASSSTTAPPLRPIPTRLPTVDILHQGRLVPEIPSPVSESSRLTEDTPDPFIVTTSVSSMISSDNTSLQYYGRTATLNFMRGVGADMVSMDRELERVKIRRSKLWKKPEWEIVVNNTGQRLIDWTIWPDDELAVLLIETYFEWVNCTVPLLHRPLFRQQYFSRLYMTDADFAKLCLTVFANGARFTWAPLAQWRRAQDVGNVTGPERPNDGVVFSDGWKFIRGLMSAGDSLHRTPTLFRLQTSVLLATFLQGNTDTTLPWAIAGNGLRAVQEIGLHLEGGDGDGEGRRGSAELATLGASGAERQLLLRAFWCLYHVDRTCCVALGRSVALQDSDIAAAYPMDVHDDWDGSDETSSPMGANKVHAFLHQVQLDRIVSAALTTLPARRDAREASSTRISAVLIELAAALNRWETSLPAALKWDPEGGNRHAPDGSRNIPHWVRTAHLHARYHWVRIFVHWAPLAARATTSGAGPDAGLTAELRAPGNRPALETVLQSARAIFGVCSALLAHDVFAPLTQRPIPFQFIDYAWVAGAAMVLGLRAGAVDNPANVDAAFAGVATAVGTMQQMECVSRNAGQVADLLGVMAGVVRAAMSGGAAAGSGAPSASDANVTLPGALEYGSVVATPDLSWLGDALFMPPIYDTSPTPGASSTTAGPPTSATTVPAHPPPHAHPHPHSQAGAADPGTGAWAQLFESFV